MTAERTERRARYARMLLGTETADQRFIIHWTTPAWWSRRRGVTDDPEHHPLGFSPPVRLGDSVVVMACAEVLVSVADLLDDNDFFGYVASVRTHLHLHALALDTAPAPDLVEMDVLAEQQRITDLDWHTFDAVRTRALESP